ncbi:hypothetical protein BJP37_20130 [Moorena bouillonii PNG]|uniref:Uncharacterized protein n=1 Tax=Moorena bouillonii PNG TaxID=568701 RepID=A0A1U7N4U6_9CYAN|nr:hypothetical protein BJP37_20130 [Moorena bouillonii PNG]
MLSLVDLRVLEIIVAYANAPLIFVQSQMSFRVSSGQRSAISSQLSACRVGKNSLIVLSINDYITLPTLL